MLRRCSHEYFRCRPKTPQPGESRPDPLILPESPTRARIRSTSPDRSPPHAEQRQPLSHVPSPVRPTSRLSRNPSPIAASEPDLDRSINVQHTSCRGPEHWKDSMLEIGLDSSPSSYLYPSRSSSCVSPSRLPLPTSSFSPFAQLLPSGPPLPDPKAGPSSLSAPIQHSFSRHHRPPLPPAFARRPGRTHPPPSPLTPTTEPERESWTLSQKISTRWSSYVVESAIQSCSSFPSFAQFRAIRIGTDVPHILEPRMSPSAIAVLRKT
jgi:hypothetical protein